MASVSPAGWMATGQTALKLWGSRAVATSHCAAMRSSVARAARNRAGCSSQMRSRPARVLRTQGLEHLRPDPGPVLYVSNHNGGILGPDLFCTLGTLWEALGPDSPPYAMAHDFGPSGAAG